LEHITIHDSSFGSEPAIGIEILGVVAEDGGMVAGDVRVYSYAVLNHLINPTSKTDEKG
jgi:hypothetical protein